MKVGITYDLRQDYLAEGYGEEETAEFDRPETIEAIERTLRELGCEAERIGHARELARRLSAGDRWDLVFNIAEGLAGFGREALVPSLLDAHRIPYTFSDPLVLSLALHKGMTNRVLRDMGIPTADFAVVETEGDIDSIRLPFPLFVKPVAEGTGKGISVASRVDSRKALSQQCGELLRTFRQPVLVETFLPGREFTVGILGTGEQARALGCMEVLFNRKAEGPFYSYRNKEEYLDRVEYRLAEDDDGRRAEEIALAAWRGLGCRDGGRVDLREDAAGEVRFLEVNPLAGLNPTHSDLPILCSLLGIPYRELIAGILESAAARMAEDSATAPSRSESIRRGPPSTRGRRGRAVILHGRVPPDAPEDERDVLDEVSAVSGALTPLGYEATPLVFSLNIEDTARTLQRAKPALVVNLVESVEGRGSLIHMAPAMLEHLGIPYTGSPAAAMFLTSNKLLAKRLLAAEGITTPPWVERAEDGVQAFDSGARLIVKSVWEHASIGLDESSVVDAADADGLRVSLERGARRTRGAVFAEAYVEGREFNLSLLEDAAGRPLILPHAEIRFIDYPEGKPRLVDYRAKWDRGSFEYKHTVRSFDFAHGDRGLLETLSKVALRCWRAFGLRGYARVDFRVDPEGRPWVLEINANPCISPDSGFIAAAERSGLTLETVVEKIVGSALQPLVHRRD